MAQASLRIPVGDVRRLTPLLVAAFIAALACAGPAQAETVVSGENDSNAPLIIDPSSDPLVADVDLAFVGPLAFIQEMPVTKVIEQVTIGDLAVADSCTTEANPTLYIREHPTGDLTAGHYQIRPSTSGQVLGETLAPVTWTLPPTRLDAGKGYSFHIDRTARHADTRSSEHGPITTAR